jgi:restriction system protein
MANQSRRVARASRRRENTAFSFLAAGGVFTILPLFFRGTQFGNGLSVLTPLALVGLAVGGLLLFLSRARTRAGASRASRAQDVPTLQTLLAVPEEAPTVELTIEELTSRTQRAAPRGPSARPTSWGPEVFYIIEWRRFEALVETLLQQIGLDTKSQSYGADGGVDVWLFSHKQPEIPMGIVQCKHWLSRQIGVDKIRELRAVMAAKKVSRGIFATTASFTCAAAQFACENGIDLLDIDKLLALIARRTPQQQQALLGVALEGDYWRPTCANCGAKMVERAPRQGGNAFWGCSNFPACKKTLSMQAAR